MKDVQTLKPFTRFLMTIGELPSSYLISMTYEEQLLWFCNFLQNNVIPVVNNNAEAVIELQNYVKNYFDNLDVQEEINNKLDEMLEDGTLQEIITEYLQINGVLGYDTVGDMVAATNIINGSICRTLGNLTYNDGKGAFYKIRTITSGDTVDGVNIIALDVSETLIAELIPDYRINTLETNVTNLQSEVNKIKDSMIIIGDSWSMENSPYLTDQNNMWHKIVAKELGLTDLNFAVSAASYTISALDNDFAHQYQTIIADTTIDHDKVKYIFVYGGLNDLNLGTPTDVQTKANTLFSNLRTSFPNSEIIVLSCNTRSNIEIGSGNTGYNNIMISNLIEKAAINNSCAFIDTTLWLFGTDNGYFSTNDNPHPNDLGEKVIASKVLSALNGNTNAPIMTSTKNTTTITTLYDGSSLPAEVSVIAMNTWVQGNNIKGRLTAAFSSAYSGKIKIKLGTLIQSSIEQYLPLIDLTTGLYCGNVHLLNGDCEIWITTSNANQKTFTFTL